MVTINVRLILAIPLYTFAVVCALLGGLCELFVIWQIVTLDLPGIIRFLIYGVIWGVVGSICWGLATLIHGSKTESA